MMTLTRWIVRATLPLTLILAACDSDAPVDERAEVAEGSLNADEAPARGKHGPPWERVCELAGCSEAQVEQVAALFKAHRPERRDDRPDPAAFQAQNAELAAKVRDGRLTAADLAAHRQAIHAGIGGKDKGRDLGAILVGLHKILSAEQRGALVDAFLAGRGAGFGAFGGHHDVGGWDHGGDGERGEHGKHEGKRGKHEGKAHGSHKLGGLGKLCKVAECSDEQRASLKALAMKSREAGEAGRAQAKATREAASKALADAFRGDAFDQAAVDRFHAAMEPLHAARMQAMDQLVVDALGIFDDAQRAKIAVKVEEKGARALMSGKGHGKRGKHGKHGGKGMKGHGKHGKHGKPEHDRVDDVPA